MLGPKKHIKLQGKLNESKTLVTITIQEQTHTGFEFGTEEGIHAWQFGSRGFVCGTVRLYSDLSGLRPRGLLDTGPHGDDVRKGVTTWVNVSNKDKKGDQSFILAIRHWEEFKAAVKAYNEYFGG